MEIYNKFTCPPPCEAFVPDPEVITEQGAEIKVRDLFERFVRGLPLPDLNFPDPEFDGDDPNSIHDVDILNEFGHDRTDYFDEISDRSDVLRDKLRAQQKPEQQPAQEPASDPAGSNE